MEIWKAIFDAYSENELFISPFDSADHRAAVENFVDTLNPTSEQKEKLETLLGDLICETEMRVFYAGFKIARRLDLE